MHTCGVCVNLPIVTKRRALPYCSSTRAIRACALFSIQTRWAYVSCPGSGIASRSRDVRSMRSPGVASILLRAHLRNQVCDTRMRTRLGRTPCFTYPETFWQIARRDMHPRRSRRCQMGSGSLMVVFGKIGLMGTYMVHCRHCGGTNNIRHGHDKVGTHRFRCHACGRTFRQQPGSRAYTEPQKAHILAAYHERCSMRGVSRVFGISRHTLSTWLKKSPEFA